jgi:signal transduction histidine kinase
MQLADFIRDNIESIVAEWEAFAATLLPAARDMTRLALRDHARYILEAVAGDITTPQTAHEQAEKSKGRAPTIPNAPETAAQTHAVLRARSGFEINQLVAEYRALRASVLRLWAVANPDDEPGVEELIRFNETIDQAIAESVGRFHDETERARNLLLGVIGHDMRSPLSAITMTASYLAALNAGDEVSMAAQRLMHSGAAMKTLLDDLVDYNKTQLGLGIRVMTSEIDLAAAVADELEQLRASCPERQLELEVSGDTRGRWDSDRLKQVLRNLISNAITYGSPDAPIRTVVLGDEAEVRLEVTNRGPAIDPSVRATLFNPLKRGLEESGGDDQEGLGLGLYIVHEVADSHGGEVEVHSGQGETTFTVHLPRQAADTSS